MYKVRLLLLSIMVWSPKGGKEVAKGWSIRVTGCFSTLGLETQQGCHLGGFSPIVYELGLATRIPKSAIKIFMELFQNLYKILLLSEL